MKLEIVIRLDPDKVKAGAMAVTLNNFVAKLQRMGCKDVTIRDGMTVVEEDAPKEKAAAEKKPAAKKKAAKKK